jgi:hypothetical protein
VIDTSGGDPDDRRILNVSAMAIRSLSPCGRGLSLSLGHKGFVPDVISNLYLVIPLALSFWLRNTPPSLGGHQHASSGNRGARRRVGRLCVELSGSFGELRFARHVLEAQAVTARAAIVSGAQDQKRSNDGLATAAAVVIFWPAAFFVGGNGQTAAELAQLKGQMVAVEQASIQKKCAIQFQGKPPAA